MVIDELFSSVATVGGLLVVGGVIALLALSWRRRAEPTWRGVFAGIVIVVLAVVILAVVAFVSLLMSDSSMLRF